MANSEHVKIARQGAEAIAKWREESSERLDLSNAALRNAALRNADLHNARLRFAILSNADLRNADLSNADLSYAGLSSADLNNANIVDTVFGYSDMSSTIGLDAVQHAGPCIIGHSTLVNSRGQIPEKFLRGCGMSPWEIEMTKLYDPDLTAFEISEIISTDLFSKRTDGPLYIGGVFISYSHADAGIADKIYEQLQGAGVSVWMDRHDMVAGDINRQVGRELRVRDIVVLILSETSVESDWVKRELRTARQKEKDEERDVLCPIAVDDSWESKMDDPAWEHLSDKLILDFSKWKTKAFTGQFDKLLKGMKINYEVKKE